MNAPDAKPSWSRIAQVAIRSLHIAAMGLVLGGVYLGGDFARLRAAILATLLSGMLLAGLDLAKGTSVLRQGSGAMLMLKLALLGLGNLFPAARLPWYLAATLVASVGSHMPGAWRHFQLLKERNLG